MFEVYFLIQINYSYLNLKSFLVMIDCKTCLKFNSFNNMEQNYLKYVKL